MHFEFCLELSIREKRIAAAIALPLILGLAATSYAKPLHHWKDMDTLQAMDLNSTFEDLDNRLITIETTLAATGSLKTTDVTATGDLSVGGTTDVGLYVVNACSFSANFTECACLGGAVAIGGGASCNIGAVDGVLAESRNVGASSGKLNDTWRVSCLDVASHAIVPTAYAFAVCARLKSN